MKKIIIEATENSPKVILDPERNMFEISGESRPKDVPAFYKPILEWLDDFEKNLPSPGNTGALFEFNLNFEYFNSLSAKYILDVCKKLNEIRSEGNNIVLKWHFEEDDDDMHEVGQEMSRISKLPFDFVEIKL